MARAVALIGTCQPQPRGRCVVRNDHGPDHDLPRRSVVSDEPPIPNGSAAMIDSRKLRDYLLSTTHPIGRSKATFFNALGFAAERWRELERAFREQHLPLPAEPQAASAYGRKFLIRGAIRGPNGRMATVVSVWIMHAGDERPHFVTAFPG